ncbi:hypothetical protein ASG47_19720 [Devosia sp. Leaf420]|uniref:hypothetical protein n=1 Tax=Devosia sp. Leaf420 TaxID=1736374 RepID=UPI0007131B44|nr:hypothetical protein [Devosia sp. Leaf420]KQT50334.1 hypothetical protein ASG47_19720 [Devosia sp. Leaf420]
MTTKREQILAALFDYLTSAMPMAKVLRNPALSDLIDGKAMGLLDGGIELVEEFINGSIYEWTMIPTISIVFEKVEDDVDGKVDAQIDLLDIVIAAAGDLNGLVTRIEVRAAELAVQEIWGSADIKGASLPIEIDYWSDRPVG